MAGNAALHELRLATRGVAFHGGGGRLATASARDGGKTAASAVLASAAILVSLWWLSDCTCAALSAVAGNLWIQSR